VWFVLEGRRHIASHKLLGFIDMADSMLANGNSDQATNSDDWNDEQKGET